MPQMAPINWLTLFIMFFSLFISTFNLIYFMFIKNKKIQNLKKYIILDYNKFI
uniref:ATP synthase complex subunit 8 n=1 Tax=Appendiseta robiniae TaxID=527541 RepID=A0A482FEP3_9HEMI|nr:ATP synthase F0 subunit 8 [Appendiseta robiniae]